MLWNHKIHRVQKPTQSAEPYSSAHSVADLRTGGRWFDPGLGHILSKDW